MFVEKKRWIFPCCYMKFRRGQKAGGCRHWLFLSASKKLCFGCELFMASWCVIKKLLTTDCSECALELLILDVRINYRPLSKSVVFRWVGKYKFLIDEYMSCHRSSCGFFWAVNTHGGVRATAGRRRKKERESGKTEMWGDRIWD